MNQSWRQEGDISLNPNPSSRDNRVAVVVQWLARFSAGLAVMDLFQRIDLGSQPCLKRVQGKGTDK